MVEHGFLRLFEEVAHLPEQSLVGDEKLADVPGWDSLAMVEFVMLADKRHGVAVKPAEFVGDAAVGDIARSLAGRKKAA
jgi:acyl carrier protein